MYLVWRHFDVGVDYVAMRWMKIEGAELIIIHLNFVFRCSCGKLDDCNFRWRYWNWFLGGIWELEGDERFFVETILVELSEIYNKGRMDIAGFLRVSEIFVTELQSRWGQLARFCFRGVSWNVRGIFVWGWGLFCWPKWDAQKKLRWKYLSPVVFLIFPLQIHFGEMLN